MSGYVDGGSEITVLPNGQVETYVRVDRKMFEDFLEGGSNEKSVEYFDQIMHQTDTEIIWPLRMRPNVRSRKDPHVKIVGTPDNVARAKDFLSSDFESRKSRVTLKMDVSFTDHSHIIGKGGRSIQAVMNETNCHIHFPDSNRTNTFEKSNQVSIAGSAVGTEKARCRIRQLLPLTVYYDLPLSCFPPQAFDATNPVTQAVQQNFGLVVSLKQLRDGALASSFGGNNYVRMSIRGTRSQVLGLRQGIAILLEQLTGGMFSFNTTAVSLDTEVAAQHHAFLMGRGNANVREIQQSCGVLIKFPDNTQNTLMAMPAASSVPMKRSTVSVTGSNFDSVFMAWQQMLGYLPLVLIFDLKEDEDVDAAMVTQMMEKLKISIIIKPKMKQNIKSIMVRGAEKESRLLFEVRKQILGLDDTEVPFCCDQHYTRPSETVAALPTITSTLNSSILPKPTLPVDSIWSTPASSKSYGALQNNLENKDPNLGKIGLPPGYAGLDDKMGKLWSYDGKSTPYPSTTSTDDSPGTTTSEDTIFDTYANGLKSARSSGNYSDVFTQFGNVRQSKSSISSSTVSQSNFWNRLASNEDVDEYTPTESASSSRASSIYDFAVSKPAPNILNQPNSNNDGSNTDILKVLSKLDLVRYADRFQNMAVQTFLNMTEARLTYMGFSLAERQTIMGAINKLKSLLELVRSSEPQINYAIAPGAERKFKGI